MENLEDELIEKAAWDNYDNHGGNQTYPQIFRDGALWAKSNSIINEELLNTLINKIKSDEVKTLSEYTGNQELLKVFKEGQISSLELLIEWINYKREIKK